MDESSDVAEGVQGKVCIGSGGDPSDVNLSTTRTFCILGELLGSIQYLTVPLEI